MESRAQQQALFDSAHADKSSGAPFEFVLLGLSTVKGLGRKGLRALYKNFDGDLEQALLAPQTRTAKVLGDARIPNAEGIAATMSSEREGILERGSAKVDQLLDNRVRVLHGKELPERLQDVPDSPYWLFVEGEASTLKAQPAVALVGTRKATARGVEATGTAVRILAPYPITVVSGLAEGIDAAAHNESLKLGIKNVAFLGTGIDIVFPKETEPLRRRIVEQGGAVATEYLPGESYGREKFVERNRLQAGLASLVIPVEAQQKSGTAHTVRFARDMKRELLGLRWKANGNSTDSPKSAHNGILDDLKAHDEPIIDIFTSAAWPKLDRIFRNLAESAGRDTYALKAVEERLLKEAQSRDVRPSDLDRLCRAIEEIRQKII